MNNYFKKVLFIGPHHSLRGGMASVLAVYSQAIPDFNFIPAYNDGNVFYNIYYFVAAILKLAWRLITDRHIRIVHLHSASRGSFLRKSIFIFIAKMLGRKTVLHIHGGEFKIFYQQSGPLQGLIRYTLNLTDEVVCLSDEWKTYFDSITKKAKTIVLNNPVVLPQNVVKKAPGHPVKVLFPNRIVNAKGIFDLVECIRQNKATLQGNLRLTIAGDGDTAELQQLVKEGGLQDIIEYAGYVTGPAKEKLIAACDVFILPSYNEGLPMAILESMSHGKAVISANVGGIPRIVKPCENGWLATPADVPGMYRVFAEILSDPGLLEKYGERSLEIVQDYSPARVNEKLNEIYTGLGVQHSSRKTSHA